jgi:hypothetical protein
LDKTHEVEVVTEVVGGLEEAEDAVVVVTVVVAVDEAVVVDEMVAVDEVK